VIPARYPLRAALQQRRALVEEARRDLAGALRAADEEQGRRRAAEAERDSLAARCDRHRRRLYEPDEKGQLQVAEVARRTEGLRHREEALDAAVGRLREREEAASRAEAAVATARARLRAVDAELEVVEKHYESWRADERREATRREERLTNEVVQARHAAARVEALERATEES
jgi:hypothetical protein